MSDSNNALVWMGAAAVGGYLLLAGSGGVAATSSAVQPPYLVPGAPALPAAYNQAYYLNYEYPAIVGYNPNVTNPNYVLTAADAQAYYSNYLDIQQWAASVVPSKFPNLQSALQYHWNVYGVPDKRSFVAFVPPDNANWVPPPVNNNSSGSSFLFSSILGDVASVAVAFAGPQNTDRLNDLDLELLFNGSAIARAVVPMYAQTSHDQAVAIFEKINDVLTDYSG